MNSKTDKNKKKAQKKKRFYSLILGTVWIPLFVIILLSCIVVSTLTYQTFKFETASFEALTYSELDKVSLELSHRIQLFESGASKIAEKKEASFSLMTNEGEVDVLFEEIQFDTEIDGKQVVFYNSESYLISKEDKSQVVWNSFNIAKFMEPIIQRAEDLPLYLVNTKGKLIYSTVSQVNNENLLHRPLVQEFIRTSTQNGNIQFVDRNGDSASGFYFIIPGTNLVMFAEYLNVIVWTKMFGFMIELLYVALGVIVFAAIVISYLHHRVFGQLKNIVMQLEQAGKGIPVVNFSETRIRELWFLKDAISKAIKALGSRIDQVREHEIENKSIKLHNEQEK